MIIYIRYSEGKTIDYFGRIKYIWLADLLEKCNVLHKLKKTERKQEKKRSKRKEVKKDY